MTRDTLGVGDRFSLTMGRGRDIADGLPLVGEVFVELRGPDGEVKDVRRTPNLVVDAGEVHIADQLSTTPGGAAMSHMAVGTGATAPAFGNTALGAEVDRNALTSRTDSGNVVTYVGTWAAGDATNSALTEAGIFNAGAAGTMLARATFTAIDKQAGDTLTITWTVTIGTSGA